ncbi:polysaccharide biosynthesis tyrosine autokinase [Agrobacterium sp. rho-13.3]|jgi:succinoglycan biosynthesis transport protein ExoP|uniref:polysaccharide biosynthesis tyrosine autokinase n=1 Tax=Agrobacterium sp. rho-13.3 TaxID=3072980 RepID=UPI002A12F84C|nr:polysaccharide biosynthesis tyrosine autokinase [Agrobacterium sp. rho-13.3]MDX8306385.1 polysaccharide biosynthesis tyrosine autokinase [Agrobacterium sp. rho-13.3]MDX8307284.1 polysaccharide biosynthesis tyrosine autokinase [Agrobacterium sp. rho-13.3]
MHHKTFRSNINFPESSKDSDTFIDLDRLWAAVLRRANIIAACVIATMVLAGLYLVLATPVYTALTQVLLDDSLSRYAEEETPVPAAQVVDNRIASAVEILKSKEMALTVVDKARLDDNETIVNPPMSPADLVKSSVKGVVDLLTPNSPPASDEAMRNGRREKAAAVIQQALTVERVGRSSVIAISIRSTDRQLATQIAKTYANSYLTEQLNANFDATERASVWLQERLNDLNQRSQASLLAVEKFKATNNIVSSRGELISESQLADLNGQLIAAQADAATASARYNQYKFITDQGPDGAINNAIVSARDTDNTVIQDLRKRYIAISDRERGVVQQFGKDHPQAVALESEKGDLARQIFQELQQLTGSFKNDFEVTQSRVQSLRENIDRVAGRNSEANMTMVKLRELEQQAAALKTLYESYLGRFEEASQKQSFPIAKARVISEAGLPTAPSSPKKTMTMALSIVLGLMLGGGVAAVLEFRDRYFHTGNDVRDNLRMRFLGYLPFIGEKGVETAKSETGAATPEIPDSNIEDNGHVSFQKMLRLAVDSPRSSFTETLRNVKLTADVVIQERQCRVIGVISCLPNEGKSVVALNLAGLIATTGKRTLVVDADIRNPGLSRMLTTRQSAGLVEVVLDEVPWTKAVKVDSRTKMGILPVSTSNQFAHSSELLASSGMRKFMDSAREACDYIIVDLAPVVPVIDAKAFASQVDGFVFVTEWGKTPIQMVQNLMSHEPQIANKTLGIVLNKTDMTELQRYAGPGGSEHYHEQFSAYYGDVKKPVSEPA